MELSIEIILLLFTLISIDILDLCAVLVGWLVAPRQTITVETIFKTAVLAD